jgi:hypothetical protein
VTPVSASAKELQRASERRARVGVLAPDHCQGSVEGVDRGDVGCLPFEPGQLRLGQAIVVARDPGPDQREPGIEAVRGIAERFLGKQHRGIDGVTRQVQTRQLHLRDDRARVQPQNLGKRLDGITWPVTRGFGQTTHVVGRGEPRARGDRRPGPHERLLALALT